jgi:hypothetical protein
LRERDFAACRFEEFGRESDLSSALFDIVDRMQSTSYGGLSVVMGRRVTSFARTRKIRAALEFAGSFEGFGPLG